MVTLWSVVFLLLNVINDGREPWITPLPGVRIEPTRPMRHEKDFGENSAYGLLLQAGEVSFEGTRAEGWDMLRTSFQEHPFPAQPPQPFGVEGAWSVPDYNKIRMALEVGDPYLELAREAIAAPDPQVPTATTPDFQLPYLSETRNLGRLLSASAYAKEGTGDLPGAMDDLLTCIRLGNLISRGGCLINHLVDVAMTAIATDALRRIPMRSDVSSKDLRRTAREILRISDHVEPFVEAMRYEALFGLACVDLVHKQGFGVINGGNEQARWKQRLLMYLAEDFTGSSPAAMKRDFTSLYQHLVDLADRPYHQDVPKRMKATLGHLKPQPAQAFLNKRDPVGFILACMLVPALGRAQEKMAQRDALLRGTALYLAILAYEKDKGAPPKALAALVPKYLPRVPVDPFDGKPFRYRTGKVPPAWGDATWGVYSIGANFRDDGGKAGALANARQSKPKRGPCPDMLWLPKPLPTR
ncbi:MAG: hypothetical protein HN380_27240 [Victivallales bacterium]|nr:hypothetical protein [Victivallales bacterium]